MSAETRLAAATPSERDVARGVFTSFAPAFTQLFPRSAGVHHPQIGVRRIDHAKRHPEVTPLSPTVAPTVLDKSELFRLVVTQAQYFVAALLLFSRFRNRHNAGVAYLLRHE